MKTPRVLVIGYDDDLNTRRAVPASGHIGPAYDAYTIPGFKQKNGCRI